MSIEVLYYPENSPYLDIALKNPFFESVKFKPYHPEQALDADFFFLFNLVLSQGLDGKEEFIDVSRIWSIYLKQKQPNIKLITLNTLPPISGSKHHINLIERPTDKNLWAFLEEVPTLTPKIEVQKNYATDFFDILYGFYVRHGDQNLLKSLRLLESELEKIERNENSSSENDIETVILTWDRFKARFSNYRNIIGLLPYQKNIEEIESLLPLIDTYLADPSSLLIGKYGLTSLSQELMQTFIRIGAQLGIDGISDSTGNKKIPEVKESELNAKSLNLSILVIDDDEMDRKIIINELSKQPLFKVDHCKGIEDGLLRLQTREYDILLLDLVLDLHEPDQFIGIVYIEGLRREFPKLKIIAMSGVFTPSAKEQVKKLGVHGIIDKYLENDLVGVCSSVYLGEKKIEEFQAWIELNKDLVYIGSGSERILWNRDLLGLAHSLDHALIYGERGTGRRTAIDYIYHRRPELVMNENHFIPFTVQETAHSIHDLLYYKTKLRDYTRTPPNSIPKASVSIEYATDKISYIQQLELICKENRLSPSELTLPNIELNCQFLIKLKTDFFKKLIDDNICPSFHKRYGIQPLRERTKEQLEQLLLFWVFKESKQKVEHKDSTEVLNDERIIKLMERFPGKGNMHDEREFNWKGNMYDMKKLADEIKKNYHDKGNFRDFELPQEMKKFVKKKSKSVPSNKKPPPKPIQRVLFAGISPSETNPLNVTKEFTEIKQLLRKSGSKIQVESSFETNWDDFWYEIANQSAQIIHIAAHGDKEGILFDEGIVDLADKLTKISNNTDFNTNVQCVILNACHSLRQAELLSKKGIYVIGTETKISDDNAIEFARGFYLSHKALETNNFIDAFRFGITNIGAIKTKRKKMYRDIDDSFNENEDLCIQLWYNGKPIYLGDEFYK